MDELNKKDSTKLRFDTNQRDNPLYMGTDDDTIFQRVPNEALYASSIPRRCTVCSCKQGLCTIFTLPGDPVPLARPRLSGSRTHMYDTQKHNKMCSVSIISQQFELLHDPNTILENVPLVLYVRFTLKLPKGSKDPDTTRAHTTKPDLSNLIKYIEDCLTGIIYRDDCLITKVISTKRYGIVPSTEFKITVLGDNEWL